MTDKDNRWIEIGEATFKLREDGRVDVFSKDGYQIVELRDLPQNVIDALQEGE